MKQLFIFIMLSCCSKLIFAQQVNTAASGNTYALIIGVAKYLDPEIPQLQFANRDAAIFADFLTSKAGGSVPKENIRLLIDSAATTGAVYDAIYWLKNSCSKDDNVYIYFSGHGDLENITMYNNGFLICFDSPPFNYVRLALSIDYLNDIANTLSAEKQANVILITDACHSGKLAENKFRGNFLAAEQLRRFRNKEIRITSSSPNQLSNEKADWGGGRGVFSYYLVNGLKGLADRNNKGSVTLDDIKIYLDSSLKNDMVLKQDSTKQTPVINGNGSFVLSHIDTNILASAQKEITEDTLRQRQLILSSVVAEDQIEASPEAYFFGLLKQENLEALTDTFRLNEIPKEKIPFTLIEAFKNDLVSEAAENKLNELEQLLRANKESLKLFNSRLATLFDAAGQRVITQYLKGDAAELEKRRYYNAAYNTYDVYPRMYEVALKLTTPDNYYYNIIKVKLHYFTGVALRLKIPLTENQKPLIEKALAEQKKALALEKYAAYIYNELGVLNSYKNNDAAAEKYFITASERAPNWAIPLSNLADLYADKGQLDKAVLYADSAKALQPGFQDIYMSYGLIYERKTALLQAEEAFQKSIKLNSRHFLPFERLGNIYMNTMQFAEADSMFYEAAERKKGFHFTELSNARHMKFPKTIPIEDIQCNIDSAYIGSLDIMGQFALGYLAYRDDDLAKAERAFKRVITLDKKNPLAYHYLGRILADQHRWQEAELILNMAIVNHLPDSLWTKYYDSLFARSLNTSDYILDPCADNCFRLGYYDQAEDYLLLAQVYENWNHFSESEIYYRKLITVNPQNKKGYVSLARLFEKTGRFNDAESLLNGYHSLTGKGLGEISSFYERVTALFPDNAEWNLKAGIFQYAIAQNDTDSYRDDTKKIDAFTGNIVYEFSQRTAMKMSAQTLLPRLIPYGTFIPEYTIPKILKPLTDGIYYLKKALTNLPYDEMVLAAVNAKIGDLYVWQRLPDSAIYFYEAAINLNPADAGTRNKLVESCTNTYRFTEAVSQLDSLLQKHELNMEKQLLLAKFKMQDGRFADAEKLLLDAENINPDVNVALTLLKGKLAVLTKNTKQALEIYNRLFLLNKQDSINLYIIARLHALSGNKGQALKWLELALQAGFNYTYVLKYDPAFKNLHNEVKWKNMINSLSGKEYVALDQN